MNVEPLQKDEAYALFSLEHAMKWDSVIVSRDRNGRDVYATTFHSKSGDFQTLWNMYGWKDKIYVGIITHWCNQTQITYAEYLKRVTTNQVSAQIESTTDFETSARSKRDQIFAEMSR